MRISQILSFTFEPLAKFYPTAFWRLRRSTPFDANTLLSIVCEFASNNEPRQNHSKVD